MLLENILCERDKSVSRKDTKTIEQVFREVKENFPDAGPNKIALEVVNSLEKKGIKYSKPSKLRAYVSGPMTGYPEHNYPAFRAVSSFIRENGFDYVDPARLQHSKILRKDAKSLGWSDFMTVDVSGLLNCTHVVLLPDYDKSTGALTEIAVAKKFGLKIVGVESFIKFIAQKTRQNPRKAWKRIEAEITKIDRPEGLEAFTYKDESGDDKRYDDDDEDE